MKKIVYIVLSMLILVSCDQEEFTGTGLESLREFTLTPIAGSKVTLNSVDPTGQIVVSWSKARSGFESAVTYTWMLDEAGGDFSSPLLSLPSDENGSTTNITFTNKQLDDALNSLGLTAGETIEAQWTVSATNGDVTEVAEAAIISITRFVDALAPFNLTSPADNTALDLDIDNPNAEVAISWEASFSGFDNTVTYQWLADVDGGDFSTPALTLDSDNSGADATLTLTHQNLEDALINLGLAEGEIVSLDWRVVATSEALELSSISTYSIDIRRFDNKVDFTIVLNSNSSDIPGGLDVFLAGEFGKLGVANGDWQQPGTNTDLQMTYNDVANKYELQLRVPEANLNTTFQFKHFLATAAAPSWDGGEQIFNASGCEGISNREATFSAASQVLDNEVIVWQGYCPSEPTMRFLLTVTANKPSDLDVYIAGALSFVTWPQPGTDDRLKMKDIGGNQFEIFLPIPNGHTTDFKFFLATKDAPDWSKGEQVVNVMMDGCDGASNRGLTFTGTESVDATVDVWEGFCPF